MQKNPIAFRALIKNNNIQSNRDLSKTSRLILEYNAEDDNLVDKINRLHRADKEIMVVLQRDE